MIESDRNKWAKMAFKQLKAGQKMK